MVPHASVAAKAVWTAYHDAAPRWQPPAAADCEAIASTLAMYRGACMERGARLAHKPDAAGRRRIARHDAVRGAIGTLLWDLPDLAAWAPGHTAPAGSMHAKSLVDLLAAARLVAMLWPSLDGSLKRFDPRTEWARTADCIAGPVLAVWQRANPGRKIGKPLSGDQPATRLMVALLGLVGHAVTAERVARHFARDKSAFVIFDANGRDRKKAVKNAPPNEGELHT